MKISARNQFEGRFTEIVPGGLVVTANITEEAIAELALGCGDAVTVIVKASDVLIGK